MAMSERNVSLEEQETTINIYPRAVSDVAEIYTCMPNMAVKLRKLAEACPDRVKITKDTGTGLFVEVPQNWVTIRKPREVHMTEEQRQAARERMMAMRENKQS